jgi:predicted acetylornithine/succinylornithine family transaminase
MTSWSKSELIAAGNRTMSLSYSPQPVIMERGSGMWLWDGDGRRYLDFLGGIAVASLGHSHPKVVAAIQAQAEKVLHVSNVFFTEPQIRLQAELVRRTFADRVFLCNSGAEAIEAAIKLARRFQRVVRGTPRFEVITFEGSFHGRTYGALSATAQPKYHHGFEPMVPGFVYAKYNDLEDVRARLGPHTAAVMVEVVQGEGGVRPGTVSFLQGLRQLCDESGVLLVVDEIQTGVGRTGTFLAHEQFGIRPDIATLAKGLAGGVPVGAMLATEEVAAGFGKGSHATTFGGNPLAAAAALAVLEVLDGEHLMASAREVGDYFRQSAEALRSRCGRVKEVRGLGLMNGIELHGTPDEALAAMSSLRDAGLLCNIAGGTTLRFVPPLIASAGDVDTAFGMLAGVLSST